MLSARCPPSRGPGTLVGGFAARARPAHARCRPLALLLVPPPVTRLPRPRPPLPLLAHARLTCASCITASGLPSTSPGGPMDPGAAGRVTGVFATTHPGPGVVADSYARWSGVLLPPLGFPSLPCPPLPPPASPGSGGCAHVTCLGPPAPRTCYASHGMRLRSPLAPLTASWLASPALGQPSPFLCVARTPARLPGSWPLHCSFPNLRYGGS